MPTQAQPRLDRDRRPGRRHRAGAGHGRRAEGRQRSPRHGHEPGARGVPAVPEGDAPRPGRPDWIARDRFVLSCGHSSLTLYIQLYLGGWGLELEDLKSLRTWGSKTPGHPEYGHTAGVETTTGPLGQGIGNAVGMAMAARRERGLLDPERRAGRVALRPPHLRAGQRRRHRGGRQLRGLLDRRHPAAGQPDPDLRRQPDLDRGRHQHRPDRGRRRALRGLRLARADRRLDQRRVVLQGGRAARSTRRSGPPSGSPTSRASSCSRRSSPGRAPNAQNTGKAHGSALGDDEVAATKKVLGFDPDQTFEVAGDVIEHTRKLRRARQGGTAAWDEQYAAWTPQALRRPRPVRPDEDAQLPEGWDSDLPTFPADDKGVATRKASGAVINAIAKTVPELWGGSADLAESNNTTIEDAPSFIPKARSTKMWKGDPYAGPGAALRHPRARHGRDPQRHRRARRHPRLRRPPS